MTNQLMKDWTLLIYANGNNDLEPEMWQSVLNLVNVESISDINVVIQVGRADQRLVKLLRKNSFYRNDDDSWTGVRRYLLEDNQLKLVGNLKKLNMADPKKLYDFIKWGMKAYPAKRYMLILGGHGYQFVGSMTDYTQKAPYIMGIPEMAEAINRGAKELGEKIDILVLDICYFNFIEVFYELGKDEDHPVVNVITYIFNGPIQGLPYGEIIDFLQRDSSNNDTKSFTKKLVETLPYDLVAIDINHELLKQIKQQFNELALACCEKDEDMDLSAILSSDDIIRGNISTQIFSLVMQYKKISLNNNPLVAAAAQTTSNHELISRYFRLSFAKQNYWTYLLSNKSFNVNSAVEGNIKLQPLKLKPWEVKVFIAIMNPGMQKEQINEILEELYRQRKWK